MKTLMISDTHFGDHPDFNNHDKEGISSRFLLQLTAINEALEKGVEYGCRQMIHLGDVFHKRGYVEPEIFNLVLQMFDSWADEYESFIILTGNHDITVEGPIFNTAMMLHGACHGKVQVIAKPQKWLNSKWFFFPFTKGDIEGQIMEHVNKKHAPDSTLFLHQSIIGAEYGKIITKGVDPKFLRQFKAVYCGHIHKPQGIGNNTAILGAPYPINFGDTGKRFCYVLDDKGKVSSFQVQHPKFITLTVREDTKDVNPFKDDGYNFYRYLSEKPMIDVPSNVRVVVQPPEKKIIRIRAANDEELLKLYCERMKRPEMYERGLQFLKERQDA